MALIQPSLQLLKSRASSFKEKMVELSSAVQEQDFNKLGGPTPVKPLDGNCSKSFSASPRDSIINKQQPSNAYESERSSTDTTSKPSSSLNPTSIKEDQKLESTRAELGNVREENERLKSVLSRILKDYESLRSQLDAIEQQEQAKKDSGGTSHLDQNMEEEAELVSLSLGTSSSVQIKKGGENAKVGAGGRRSTGKDDVLRDDTMNDGGRLTLGLDCSSTAVAAASIHHHHPPSAGNSSEDVHKGRDDASEPWQPGKALKSPRSGDDEVSQQFQIKKARVSVRARCDAPTMSDGCQWRKYGQKISKGNPRPRAYYRCTVAPSCPVRKQVQRCAEDMSILVTTYEGAHNHQLPTAATAMASTTSAAAKMLTSGSSTGARAGAEAPLAISSLTGSGGAHYDLSFNVADGGLTKQHCLPTSPAINVASPLYPTITLDLTSPSSSAGPASTQFGRFAAAANNTYAAATTGYSTAAGFRFSSMDSTTSAASPWSASSSSITGGYLGYGSTNPFNSIAGRQTTAPQGQSFYNQPSYLQKTTATPPPPTQSNTVLTDTIAKAITTDPSFQSALTAAITSIVAGRSQAKEAGSEGLGQTSWWGSSVSSTSTAAAGANGSVGATSSAAASYVNRAGGLQGGSLLFLQPPLGFSDAKNKSTASPFDREQGA